MMNVSTTTTTSSSFLDDGLAMPWLMLFISVAVIALVCTMLVMDLRNRPVIRVEPHAAEMTAAERPPPYVPPPGYYKQVACQTGGSTC